MPSGGARKGAGRKPDLYKARMREIASSKDALKFIEGGIRGEKVDHIVNSEGKVIVTPADGTLKLKLIQHASDQGYGKPTQSVEMTGDVSLNLIEAVKLARLHRGKA